ncbi:MAG: hisE [Clostridiales bacterium]|nr:hisE [Clostridiales bacterium]
MENILNEIKFDNNGLIPVVVQDYKSDEVLMLAYMNKETLEKTLETGKMTYWSRSRQNGHYSCFYREIDGSKIREVKYKAFDPEDKKDNLSISPLSKEVEEKSRILQEVYDVIIDRMANPKEGSYTNYLFDKGLDKILKKVGEETSEVIIAAKNKNKDELRYEVSDLLYHLFVLLAERGVSLDDIYNELKHRR